MSGEHGRHGNVSDTTADAVEEGTAAWPYALPQDDPRHGTANGYQNLGCRCQPCRDAYAAVHLDYMNRSEWQRRLHSDREGARHQAGLSTLAKKRRGTPGDGAPVAPDSGSGSGGSR